MNLDPIQGSILMEDQQAKAAIDGMADEVRKFRVSVDSDFAQAAKSGSDSFRGMLNDLKSEFGKTSLFGQSLKLATGGGAIAALGMAASKIDEMSAKIALHSEKLRDGTENWADFGASMARSLPIIGSLASAWDNFSEAFTGAKAEEAHQAAMLKEIDQEMADHKRFVEQQAASTREWAKEIRGLNDELAQLNAGKNFGSSPELKQLQDEQKYRDALKENDQQYLFKSGLQDGNGNPGKLIQAEREYQNAKVKLDSLAANLRAAQAEDSYDPEDDSYDEEQKRKDISAASDLFEAQDREVVKLKNDLNDLHATQQRALAEHGSIADAVYQTFLKNEADQQRIEDFKAFQQMANGNVLGTGSGTPEKDLQEINKLIEDFQSPMDRFADEITHLNQLH